MIYEDPDDVGFWIGGPKDKPRWWPTPESMCPDLGLDEVCDPRTASSDALLRECNLIMGGEHVAAEVSHAAHLHLQGHYDAAEECRMLAGYNGLDA